MESKSPQKFLEAQGGTAGNSSDDNVGSLSGSPIYRPVDNTFSVSSSPEGSPYRIKTPRPIVAYSPPHTEYPDHKFHGCSSILDYEINDKLGEGTFG
ncbi:13481_t:CDS:2, partial [Acaulospora morrowiae]